MLTQPAGYSDYYSIISHVILFVKRDKPIFPLQAVRIHKKAPASSAPYFAEFNPFLQKPAKRQGSLLTGALLFSR